MQDVKERVALGSVAVSAGLTLAKAVVGLASGSLAILSEAAHSLIDLAATSMTFFAIRISGKPADAEHHYGHGKVESVAALIETGLLFVLSVAVIVEAGRRLLGAREHAVEATIAAFLVIALSVAVDFFRSRLLYRVAAETSSEALEADGLHFRSDMWSSLAVLVGLAGVAAGYPWADSAAAIVVAVFVCLAGYRLGRRTVDTLTDTAPQGIAERIATVARRGRDRAGARAPGRAEFVHRCRARHQPHAAARPRHRDQGRSRARDPRRTAQCRGDHHHQFARARRGDGARAHHGDRAQPRARSASRHGARDRRAARRVARSRSRRRARPQRRA